MVAPDITEVASHLRLAVTRLARKLRREAEGGLTPTMLAALATIDRLGPVTIGDLSAHEQVSGPTMTRIVAHLADAGLVVREPDVNDRRIAWMSTTPEGRRLLQRSRKRKEAYLARRLRTLPPDDLELLERASALFDRLAEGR